MWSPEIIAFIAVAFVLAGFVKGVVGVGLPAVSLGLLAAFIGLKEAMALMLVPAFLTNLWQSFTGGSVLAVIRRFWSLLVAGALGVWVAPSNT